MAFLEQLANAGRQMQIQNNPTWAKIAQEQQIVDAQMQQQRALQDLATRYSQGNVGALGPQKALGLDDLITQGAMITGDISPLATLAASREKQMAEQTRLKALQDAMFRPGPASNGVSPTDGQQPLNVRNNNPGNLRPVGQTQGFQGFKTPEEGMAAMVNDLTAKVTGNSPAMKARFGEGYQPTLANVITTWAPPEENDTKAYIDAVSKKSGVKPDQVLSLMDIQRIMPAMIEQEGGGSALEHFAGGTTGPTTPTPTAPTQSPALEKLAQLAQIDPETFGDDYLTALADEEKAKLEAAKTDREVKGNLTKGEQELRKEFESLPDVKSFREVEAAYQRVLKATKKPSAAGDVAMIFNFMKMLDPGSTVREGEFATAAASAGLDDRIIGYAKKIDSGERLAPDQRADFLNQAKGQYEAAEDLFIPRADQYEKLASEYDYKPSRIVTRARVDVPRETEKTTVTSGWDDAKEKRLMELRAKRDGGLIASD